MFYLQGSQYMGKLIFAKIKGYQIEFHIKTNLSTIHLDTSRYTFVNHNNECWIDYL